MSCGMTATPPRRATVSAMRRPATAVMFDTTTGTVVPVPSSERRSTSRREATPERDGTMNTSSYVRSWAGGGWRKRMVASIASDRGRAVRNEHGGDRLAHRERVVGGRVGGRPQRHIRDDQRLRPRVVVHDTV